MYFYAPLFIIFVCLAIVVTTHWIYLKNITHRLYYVVVVYYFLSHNKRLHSVLLWWPNINVFAKVYKYRHIYDYHSIFIGCPVDADNLQIKQIYISTRLVISMGPVKMSIYCWYFLCCATLDTLAQRALLIFR